MFIIFSSYNFKKYWLHFCTLSAGQEMVGYTMKAGGDGQLHAEGWMRWSATRWRLEEMSGYTRHHSVSLTECNLCVRRRKLTAVVGLGDISHAICMRISSVKPVSWLAVNHLFSNGAAFNTQSRKSLTSYAISRSYRRRYISRYMRSLSVNYGSVY